MTDPDGVHPLVGVATSALADRRRRPPVAAEAGDRLLTTRARPSGTSGSSACAGSRGAAPAAPRGRSSSRASSSSQRALEAGAPVEAVFVDDRARSHPEVTAVLDARPGAGGPGLRPRPRRARTGGRHGHAPARAGRGGDARRRPRATWPSATFVVVCVDVRDPGNAGAVIRVRRRRRRRCRGVLRGNRRPLQPEDGPGLGGLGPPSPGRGRPAMPARSSTRSTGTGSRRLAAVSRGGTPLHRGRPHAPRSLWSSATRRAGSSA